MLHAFCMQHQHAADQRRSTASPTVVTCQQTLKSQTQLVLMICGARKLTSQNKVVVWVLLVVPEGLKIASTTETS